jgi:carboxypeptidase C (cathepsin A)
VAARPLTFLWNGGPGSNSGLVHLLGFGPKRIAMATGTQERLSPAGTTLVDNDGTWLDRTDLVFVDPIGTGYSRPARAGYAGEFYQSPGDAESVAEFIRVYRTRYNAFDAPLFIAGESYGVTRCALVAEALERRGTTLSGVILMGLALPVGEVPGPMRAALGLPTFTAAAFVNHRLASDLQSDLGRALAASERWATTRYAAALARRDSLTSSERDAIVAELARFSGLPAGAIDRTSLRITMEQFSVALLADEKRVVGRYDSRLTGPRATTGGPYDPTRDPGLKDILDGVSVIRYLRNEIGYRSDLFYQGPFGGGYPPPTTFRGDWMSVRWDREAQPDPQALHKAMAMNPRLDVFIACGHFDLVCAYSANEYAAAHLPADIAGRVTAHSYGGGHAIYTDDAARLQLKHDVAVFIAERVSTQGRKP